MGGTRFSARAVRALVSIGAAAPAFVEPNKYKTNGDPILDTSANAF